MPEGCKVGRRVVEKHEQKKLSNTTSIISQIASERIEYLDNVIFQRCERQGDSSKQVQYVLYLLDSAMFIGSSSFFY